MMNWKYKLLWMCSFVFLWLAAFLPTAETRAMSLMSDTDSAADTKRIRHVETRKRKRLERQRVAALQQDMLEKLGMTSAPDATRSLNASSDEIARMTQLYYERMRARHDTSHVLFHDDNYAAKQYYQFKIDDCQSTDECLAKATEQGLLIQHPLQLPDHDATAATAVGDASQSSRVQSASLRLYKHHVQPENIRDSLNADQTVRISIYQLIKSEQTNKTLHRSIDSKMVSLDTVGWETFDVTALVTQWHENPVSNQGLLVICDSQPLSEVVSFLPTAQSHDQLASRDHTLRDQNTVIDSRLPVFDVYTQKQSHARDRRSLKALETYDCRRGDGETRCCRYPLEIRFKEIGWDWIREPAGFRAYYCDGGCPRSYKLGHRFAEIQSLMHSFNPAAAPAPCCSASRLEPLEVMFVNQYGHLEIDILTDMIVTQCRCS